MLTRPAELAVYRAEVDQIVDRFAAGFPSGVSELAGDLTQVPALLEALPGTADRIDRELWAFRPSDRSNAPDAATMLRILLLQLVEQQWWGDVEPFADDEAVRTSPALASLTDLSRRDALAFRFTVAATTLPGRARGYARRRWAGESRPRSSGLSYPLARPAMVVLLNDIARRFADAVPSWPGGMWVNCLVRSEGNQRHLRTLGYSAVLPSTHCAGYAADVEMAWLAEHGVAEPLQEILLDLRDQGMLNVIDEGQAWHLCPNPRHIELDAVSPARRHGQRRTPGDDAAHREPGVRLVAAPPARSR